MESSERGLTYRTLMRYTLAMTTTKYTLRFDHDLDANVWERTAGDTFIQIVEIDHDLYGYSVSRDNPEIGWIELSTQTGYGTRAEATAAAEANAS